MNKYVYPFNYSDMEPVVNSIFNIHDLGSFIEFNRIGVSYYPELYLIGSIIGIYIFVCMSKFSNKVVISWIKSREKQK